MNALAKIARRGVVLVNVGTPDAPTVPAVRRYLAEFLNDPRVVDLPALGRWLLLNLIILPFRPRRSAHAYQQIWTERGSPLLIHAQAQRDALAAKLPGVEVVTAMRYGQPSLASALERLRGAGVEHVTLVPMYPQLASATTGTTVEAWFSLMGRQARPMSVAVAPPFFDQPGFVEAAAARLREVVAAQRIEHVVFSYHGLPVRQIARVCGSTCAPGAECPALGAANQDCYRAQCFATSRALATAAGVSAHTTSFQSRIKGTAWISPFTDDTLVALAQKGVKRVAVACPSFVADCLETLEEIGMRARATFVAAGGEELVLVPAVNDDPRFIDMLASLTQANAGGVGT